MRPRKLCDDTELDWLAREPLPELLGLLAPELRERACDAGVAVHELLDAELALAVTDEEGALHQWLSR